MPAVPVRPLLIGIVVTLTAAVGVSLWGWFRIPDHAQVALHWNLAGEADITGLALVAVLHGAVVLDAVTIARLLTFGVGALYVVLGVYLLASRPNYSWWTRRS